MKHKLAGLISVYLCLLIALSFGTGEFFFADRSERPSYTENRMLSAFPALSAETVFDGSFMDGFESWLSDAFFFREQAAGFSDAVKALFQLPREGGELISSQPQAWELNEEEQRELDNMLEETDAQQSETEPPSPPAEELSETDAPPPADAHSGAALSAEDCRRPTPAVTQSASFWTERANGSLVTVESFSPDHIATAARVLNEYRAALPADGTVSLINPMVADIANTVLQNHSAVDWGCDLDEVLQPYLDEGVRFYDLTDILRPYIGKADLYPTIDHHWHPISCKLAQDTMLRDQNIIAAGYDEYLYWLDNVHDAGPFTAEELPAVTRNIEQIPILLLNAPAESYMVEHLNERSPGVLNDHEAFSGYSQYLGGNRHTWREFVTGFHTGRNALVIGDSFDLPFIAYLFPYYDTIIVTDFRDGGYALRESGANVRTYIDYYDVSDVYVIYCSYFSINTETMQDRMERYFFMEYEN